MSRSLPDRSVYWGDGGMKHRTEAAIEALRAKRAHDAYQLLRVANGLPPDRAAHVLLVPVYLNGWKRHAKN